MNHLRAALWTGLFSCLVAACTARSSDERQCTFNRDCQSPLVCASGFCRAQCADARDCLADQFCVPGKRPEETLCLSRTSHAICSTNAECPTNWVCAQTGHCLPSCTINSDCRGYHADSLCAEDHHCMLPQLEATADINTAPKALTLTNGFPSTIRPGEDLQLIRVRVTDAAAPNAPHARWLVHAAATGGTDVFPPTTLTNQDGVASFRVHAPLELGHFEVEITTANAEPLFVEGVVAAAASNTVSTIAGDISEYDATLPGALKTARLPRVRDVASGPDGHLFIASVDQITSAMASGYATGLAGHDGNCTSAGSWGPAARACLQDVSSIAYEPTTHELYVVEYPGRPRFRRIDLVSEIVEPMTVTGLGAQPLHRTRALRADVLAAIGPDGVVEIHQAQGAWTATPILTATQTTADGFQFAGCGTGTFCELEVLASGEMLLSARWRSVAMPTLEVNAVYLRNAQGTMLQRVAGGGTTPPTSATPATNLVFPAPASIALDAARTTVFLLDGTRVWSMPVAGGMATPVAGGGTDELEFATAQNARISAADHVFVTSFGKVLYTEPLPNATSDVVRVRAVW